MREIVVSNIGAVNFDKLDADIRAVCPRFAGLSRRRDRTVLYLLFEDNAEDAEMATAQGLARSHDPNSKTPEQQVLDNVRSTAASAAGVALADLTAGQRNALMAVLLWKAGGIAPDGTIRPLSEWAR